MHFVILHPRSCKKKMKEPSFLIQFGKRIEDKWWLGLGLGGCNR